MNLLTASEEAQMRVLNRGLLLIERALTREPDCCAGCVNWTGRDNAEFAHCPVIDYETADSSVCEQFERKP